MANRGKAVTIYLMDGEVTGRIKCSLSNWTGIAYKIPRNEIDNCKDRSDLKQSGVYFLIGKDEVNGIEKDVVYIGQAGNRKNGEGILNRLTEHRRNPNKEFWTDAVVFTTSNNSFGPTEISYLENRFCAIATEANRYEIRNGNEPCIGNITEEKESELEEFIDYAKISMGALGYKVFEPLVKNRNEELDTNDETTLYFSRYNKKLNKEIKATCKITNEGFVLLKGSEIIDSNRKMPGTIEIKRKKAKINDKNILQEDLLFSSSSYAAAFVVGGHISGPQYWKNKDGITLKELEEKEII